MYKYEKRKHTIDYNKPNNRIRSLGEVNSGEKLVHDAGYIPIAIRIARLTAAGQQMIAYRDELYDFKNLDIAEFSKEMDWEAPRAPNYDVADASMALRKLEAKLTEKAMTEKRKKALEQQEAAQEAAAEPDPPNPNPAE